MHGWNTVWTDGCTWKSDWDLCDCGRKKPCDCHKRHCKKKKPVVKVIDCNGCFCKEVKVITKPCECKRKRHSKCWCDSCW